MSKDLKEVTEKVTHVYEDWTLVEAFLRERGRAAGSEGAL